MLATCYVVTSNHGRSDSTISVELSWMLKLYSYWSFFFFQAEDGIRDLTVTGVQTCALPISVARTSLAPHYHLSGAHVIAAQMVDRDVCECLDEDRTAIQAFNSLHPRIRSFVRSEERRVGKECRSRWSPYH